MEKRNFLGSASAFLGDFQPNELYFMGVSDASNVIRSIVLYNHAEFGDVIGLDDLRFATVVPEPSILILMAIVGIVLARYRWQG